MRRVVELCDKWYFFDFFHSVFYNLLIKQPKRSPFHEQCHLDNDLKTKTKGLTIRKKGSQFFLFLKNMFFRMTIKQMLPSA